MMLAPQERRGLGVAKQPTLRDGEAPAQPPNCVQTTGYRLPNSSSGTQSTRSCQK